ncbi:hypothetical protein ACFYKT_01065 [Cytobacillus sp. FJAT-53684]|uniref:Uncharacterized protein n=1 Tax=Cytobacillus mangrovibacter TaxID=3299024 RepID=A0ABW6JSV6_9BACI
MSDFMKSIVQEVMKPSQKSKVNPLFGRETNSIYSRSTVHTTNDSKDIQTIPGVDRPNYQQKNRKKRLAVIEEQSPAPKQIEKAIHPAKNVYSPPSKGFDKSPLAKLQTMSLVQGNHSNSNQQVHSAIGQGKFNQESQCIGQTKDGVKAWLFSYLHPHLQSAFSRSLKSNAIGVITAEKCTAGQLFLLNEMLREFSTLKYFLTWDKENTQGFVLELYEDNPDRLTKSLKALFQKLSQNVYKQIQVFKTQAPSPWLTKQLDLKTHVDGVAVIEGIDYYSAILYLDRFLKKSNEANFSYVLEKNYLLLHGNYDIVSKVSEELQRQVKK